MCFQVGAVAAVADIVFCFCQPTETGNPISLIQLLPVVQSKCHAHKPLHRDITLMSTDGRGGKRRAPGDQQMPARQASNPSYPAAHAVVSTVYCNLDVPRVSGQRDKLHVVKRFFRRGGSLT